MAEIWKPVSGYEGIYDVSDKGRVRSYRKGKHGICKTPKILKGQKGLYKTVTLCRDNRKTTTYVHRLVAEQFIQNPNNYRVINHLDGDKYNNRVENLEWTTYSGNIQHAIRSNLCGKCKKVICKETGETYISITEWGKMFGMKQSQASVTIHKGATINGKTYQIMEEQNGANNL